MNWAISGTRSRMMTNQTDKKQLPSWTQNDAARERSAAAAVRRLPDPGAESSKTSLAPGLLTQSRLSDVEAAKPACGWSAGMRDMTPGTPSFIAGVVRPFHLFWHIAVYAVAEDELAFDANLEFVR